MNESPPFPRTLIVWWFFGREHGGDEIQANPVEIVTEHIREKADRFREMSGDAWRWWQVDDDLIFECPQEDDHLFGPDSRIYYLLERGIAVIENLRLPPPDEHWKWYIHIADFNFDTEERCWLMKDLFCDVLIGQDERTYKVLDLPDLAQALDVGLITKEESSQILQRVDTVVADISEERFPYPEIFRGAAAVEHFQGIPCPDDG